MHINSGIPNQAFYLAIEGGTNRTSGLSVQGVGGGQPRADRKGVLPGVHAAAARERDVRRRAGGDDSGGAGSVRRQQRRGARRHAGLDRRRGELMAPLDCACWIAALGTGRVRVLALGAAAVLATTTPAAAQGARSRVVLSRERRRPVGRARPVGSLRVRNRPDRERRRSTCSIRRSRAWSSTAALGFRLWKNLGAGVAVSHASGDGTAEIDAQMPHPLQFEPAARGQRRAGRDHAHGDRRARAAPGTRCRWRSRVALVLSAGPSWLNVEQEIVTDVLYDEDVSVRHRDVPERDRRSDRRRR